MILFERVKNAHRARANRLIPVVSGNLYFYFRDESIKFLEQKKLIRLHSNDIINIKLFK